jgi:hypothetical protein
MPNYQYQPGNRRRDVLNKQAASIAPRLSARRRGVLVDVDSRE